MLSIKLKLVFLNLKKCINRLFIHFLNLLLFGARHRDAIIISLLILFSFLQFNLKRNSHIVSDMCTICNSELVKFTNKSGSYNVLIVDQNNGEVIHTVNIEDLKEGNSFSLNGNSDYILYSLMILVIISLWVLIFKINNTKIELPAKASLSNIEQLIINDKIELALKKLYKQAKLKDEELSNEILLLKNGLFRGNKNRLNGLLRDNDYNVMKNKVVKRIIDIIDELKLH